MTTVVLNLAGVKKGFNIVIDHKYDNVFSFYIEDCDTKGIVLDGGITRNGYYSFCMSQSIKYFETVLEKKVKTLLRKTAKKMKLKIRF